MVIASVKLWEYNVGAVAWDQDKKVGYFEFEKDFLNTALDISPLMMSLDSARRGAPVFNFPLLPVETFKGLPGLLADSLPDRFGTSLLNEWLISQGRDINNFSPVERLCYIGKRGMGALEYEPELDKSSHNTSPLELSGMVKLTNDILLKRLSLKTNMHTSSDEAILRIIQVGSSAGGARPKAIIGYNEKTGEILSGQAKLPNGFTNCLIKLDGVTNDGLGDPAGFGRIEYAYFKMAKDSGIEISNSKLLEENGRAHFITERFDRLPGNQKLHVQTLCGLAHFDFNNPNIYSYEQAFQVMREIGLPYPDAEQLYVRMVFNDITKNYDDHSKNISFLMDKNENWRLAPAYDITFAYNPANMWLQRHQLSINGKRDKITNDDYLAVAKQMSIKKPKMLIDRVKTVVNNWKTYAKDSGVLFDQIQAIDKVINANKPNKNILITPEIKNKKRKGLSL